MIKAVIAGELAADPPEFRDEVIKAVDDLSSRCWDNAVSAAHEDDLPQA